MWLLLTHSCMQLGIADAGSSIGRCANLHSSCCSTVADTVHYTLMPVLHVRSTQPMVAALQSGDLSNMSFVVLLDDAAGWALLFCWVFLL